MNSEKLAGYIVNTWKSVVFLFANSEQFKKEMRKTIPCIRPLQRMKYLGIHLNKEVKDLYDEKYTTLMKLNTEDLNKCKYIPHSWMGRLNTVMIPVIPKVINRFSAIHSKNPNTIFGNTVKPFLKFIGNLKGPLKSQSNLQKEEQSWRTHTF